MMSEKTNLSLKHENVILLNMHKVTKSQLSSEILALLYVQTVVNLQCC